MSTITHVDPPAERAEGDIYYPSLQTPVPYHTFLVSDSGVHIHFWLKYPYHGAKLAKKLKAFASNFRDIVSVSYSEGKPIGYTSHEDMRPL